MGCGGGGGGGGRERQIQYLEARNWLQMPLWPLDLPSLKLPHCYVHRLKDSDSCR